jgi:hypothetical protein
LAGIEPPVRVTVVALTLAVPPLQVVLAAPEVATPAGNVSVSGAVRLAAVAFELLKVIVSVEPLPAMIVDGLKALPTTGGIGGTEQTEMETTFESIVTAPV